MLNKSSQPEDPRVFFNISEPSSVFICGSQGSGKSHTLSCFLENCLMRSDVSKLSNPLSALVLHYDNFTNDARGTPCEAAHLGSNPNIKVRVLCSPTNIETTKRTYKGMNVSIEPLRINQTDLNTKRMLDLMAVSTEDGPMPLYLHSVNRILRQMRIEQQQNNSSFNYGDFKIKLKACPMTPAQLAPLTQRLDTLESFMPRSQTDIFCQSHAGNLEIANDWSISPGLLTIVDLSCPCITSEGACALFNMCLGLFLEQSTDVGRIVALDEAHKYMNSTTEAATLSETLLTSIRMQRHLGTRIFISTQEPTISPALLDLCSVTIVHRFTSPEWLRCLRQHLAALDQDQLEAGSELDQAFGPKQSSLREILAQIVQLRVGEALLFSPSAVIDTPKEENDLFDSFDQKLSLNDQVAQKLGVGYLKIRIRDRLTEDGGKSVLAL